MDNYLILDSVEGKFERPTLEQVMRALNGCKDGWGSLRLNRRFGAEPNEPELTLESEDGRYLVTMLVMHADDTDAVLSLDNRNVPKDPEELDRFRSFRGELFPPSDVVTDFDLVRQAFKEFMETGTVLSELMPRWPGFDQRDSSADPLAPLLPDHWDGSSYDGTNQGDRLPEPRAATQATLVNENALLGDAEDIGKSRDVALVNSDMSNAHAEIAIIQQAYDDGNTQGKDLTMTLRGRKVCDYCLGDVRDMAIAAGLESVTINAYDQHGIRHEYVWKRGMKKMEIK